jgi:hypothetical protein
MATALIQDNELSYSFDLTENVKKWWIWGYWISPLMYAQNAISVNEFLGSSWNKVLIIFSERYITFTV